MLDNLRNFGRSWTAKILLGLLIVAVAGFGVPSVFLDLNSNTVARVGDQNISVNDFNRVYRAQLNQYAAQTGSVPSAQQAMSLGLPSAALGRLAGEASVEMLARDLDLGASEDKVASLVRQDPSFAGALGTFDRDEFTAVLRQAGYTESEYLKLQQRTAKREQVGMVFDNIELPQTAVSIARAYDTNRRVVEFVELNPILFQVAEEPSEEELAAFFEENRNRFRTEETREVRLLPLTPEALAANVEVTEEEIAAEYERTASQYTTIERRTVHQLLLDDPDVLAAFEEGLEVGTGFQDLVAQEGLEGEVNELGTFAQSQMTDRVLAEAAFGLDEGGFTIVQGALGERAVWVSDVIEGGQQPLEDVRDQIAEALALERARRQLAQVYDDIDEARAALQPVDDVAAQHGLEIYDIELTRSGAALDTVRELPEATHDTVVSQIFAASPDAAVSPAINLGSNRTVFFELEVVHPERDQELDEVREEAIAAWQQMQTEMAMTEAAETMVASLDSGNDMFTVAAEAGQIPQASQPFGRNGTDGGAIGPDVARAAFMGGPGHAGYAQTADGDVVVFQVTEVIEGDGATSPIANAITANFPDLLYASFVEGLQQDQGIRVNQEAFNRVVGLE